MVPKMSAEFRGALRAELVDRAESARHGTSRRWWRWIAGGTLGLLFAGGATLAAADLFTQPGAPVTSTLGAEVVSSGTGSRSISLGPAPEGATAIWIGLNCLSSGALEFGTSGGSATCTDADAGSRDHRTFGALPLSVLDGDAFALRTSEHAKWELTLAYVHEEPTDWAVNEAGESFGVQNDDGTPDLIAVMTTEGRQGYVHRDELEEADGTAAARRFTSPEQALEWQEERAGQSFSVPVYESDGTTLIGEFVIPG